jgi:hypothetical protein
MRRATVLLLAVLAAGCGGAAADRDREGQEQAAAPGAAVPVAALGQVDTEPVAVMPEVVSESWRPVPPPDRTSRCYPGVEQPLGTRVLSYAGVAKRRVTAYREPGRHGLRTFERLNVNHFPTVFGVLGVLRGLDCEPEWYRVQLPIRPNGSVGYVRASAVELVEVRTRIEVDLSERRLELFRDGKLVHRLATAIGSDSTPTPTGRYYVNQRLIPADPTGPWGPAGIGISAFSPVLVHWAQGGPIAIHGTNNPSSVGKPASNGCLRLSNEDLMLVWDQTPAGTPVVIRA